MTARSRLPLHPLLVTVPIGCWVASLVFDIASRFAAEPGFLARGAYWLIGIGLAGAIIAGIAGLIDTLPIPANTKAQSVAMVHFGLVMTAILVYGSNYVLRAGEGISQPVSGALIALSSVGVANVLAAALAGGSLAHRHKVALTSSDRQHHETHEE